MDMQYMNDVKILGLKYKNNEEYDIQESVGSYIGNMEYRNTKAEQRIDKMRKYDVNTKTNAFDIQRKEEERQQELSQSMMSGKKEDKIRANIIKDNAIASKIKEQNDEESYDSVEMLQKKLGNLQCHPDVIAKFAPAYVSEHFAEVRQFVDEVAKIAEVFERQPTIYAMIQQMNIITYDFIDFSNNCQQVFNTSLAIHGLCYDRKSGAVFEIDEQKKQVAKTNLLNDMKAVTFIFKKAKYEKEEQKIKEMSSSFFGYQESKEYLKRESDLDNIEDVVNIRKKIGEDDLETKKYQDILDKMFENYIRVDKLAKMEQERLEYMQGQKDQHIPSNRHLTLEEELLEHHFNNEIVRISKMVIGLKEERKIMLKVFRTINQKMEFTEEQKEYLSKNYGMKFELYKEDIKTKQENKIIEESVKAMCEKLHYCHTKFQFLMLKNELCALAERLLQMIEKNVGTENDFCDATGIWKLNVNKIIFSAKKARAIEIISGCARWSFSIDDLTQEEYNSIAAKKGMAGQKNGEVRSLDITTKDIEEYARESFNTAEAYIARVRKDFMHENKEVEIEGQNTIVNTRNDFFDLSRKYRLGEFGELDPKHKEFSNTFSLLCKLRTNKNSRRMTPEESEKMDLIMSEYEKRKKKIHELLDEYKKATGEDKFVKREELKVYISEVHDYEIVERMQNKYYVYGDKKNADQRAVNHEKTADLLLRSTKSVDAAPEYSKMSNGEMRKMFGMMSAGVFEENETDEELRELYLEVNKEGMELYKKKMMDHYKYMYKKYGLTYPSVEYAYEHYREMQIDFSFGQVDTMMKDGVPQFLDKSKLEDRLLMALMDFYQVMNTRYVAELASYYTEKPSGQLTPEQFYERLRMTWFLEIAPYAQNVRIAMTNVN